MKPRSLRLRLVVRRHELPETRIIFTVSLEDNPSIADLIEQVNGVVPLESDDWGLEDYVAELRDAEGNAFDLLHFQGIASVLKPDEEVFVRPLLANDRRRRRLGGRDQITNDGRHLIDGVPFGRPRFNAPRSRPSISIPPLKRRRITHEEEEELDDSDEDEDRPHKSPAVRFDVPDDESDGSDGSDAAWLKRLAGPTYNQLDDGQHGNDEEDDNDSDFAVNGEGEDLEEDQSTHSDEEDDGGRHSKTSEELLQELRDLQAANELIQDEEQDEEPIEEQEQEQEQAEEQEAPAFDGLSAEERATLTLVDLDRITALRVAFPTASVEECEKTLFDCRRKEKTAYRRLIKKHETRMTLDDMSTYFGTLRGGYLQTRTLASDDDAQSEASDADSVESFVRHYDKHGFPSGSIMAGTAATHVAEALRKSGQLVKLPVHTRFTDDLEGPLDSEDEREDANKIKSDGLGEGFDIDESSSSDSEAGPEVESSKPAKASGSGLLDIASSDSDLSDSDSSSEDDSDSDSGSSSSSNDSDSDSDANADEDSDDDVSFQGGSDVGGSDSGDDKSSSSEDSSDSGSDAETHTGAPLPSTTKSAPVSNEAAEPDIPTSPQLLPPVPAPTVAPGQGMTKTQRRNARRRAANRVKRFELQYGADADITMGDEASGDEAALAAKKAALMESLGFTPDAPTTFCASAPAPASRSSPEKDPEAWRSKITYRAVECCQEGITLSEPPFPFYQRWDPQQQFKKRFSKRKQHDQSGYYEDVSQVKKRRRTQDSSRDTNLEDDKLWDASYLSTSQYNDSNIVLNYDDEPGAPAEDTTAAHGGQEDVEDDLTPLPTDLSCLPALEPGAAKSGMIITWKQMIMSKATNWAPQVFSLTGSVIDVYDDGSLRVLLAKRDRHIGRNEKQYDQDGNRVYDKFEFPGLDDELEEELELGYRTLDPLDIMETRILQQPPDAAPSTSPSAQKDKVTPVEQTVSADLPQLESGNGKSSSSEESITLDHEDTVIPASQDRAKADSQPSGGTVIPETNNGSPEHVSEPQAPLLDADEEDAMSEDRRLEISQLINDAGFRKEIDPSIGEKIHKPASVSSSSPSRQLEETLKEAASAASHRDPKLSSFSNPSQEVSQATSSSSMSVDCQPIILEPFHGFSDEIEEPSEDPVEYPTLDLPPSDIGSTHSGRQPDPDFSIELGNTSPDRLDTSFSAPRDKTPPASKEERKPQKVSPAKSDSSTNSFPSLSEISLTASTQATQASQSSTSQAAISSALKVRKSDVVSAVEYEEARRKLDEGVPSSDSETELPKLKIKRLPAVARDLLKKPIEKPAINGAIVKEDTENSSARPMRSTRTSRSFTIPAGSQVVSLISSSPEPELENYAEDDVDETYEADSFPSEQDSPGWGEKGRSRRGASVPLSALLSSKRGGTNVPNRLASSQGGKPGRSVPPSRKENKKKTTTRGW